ncbi:hypothetical protein ACFOWU_03775 [Epilithonimonas zeae]|uniref:Uncharacterized protein n=1 Tax=Epilithonimonas zeae TaxID=1416779 RepID=A0A1N6ERJ1_9FLAO|nr:hypothetical protein [Epilithonimonas zeae]SIN85553.1 hypothetical protein SAMN05444409_0800 [Epilithonimonas zeae]
MITIFFIIGFMVLFYGGVMYFMYAKKQKMKQTLQSTDFKSEFQRAETYKSNFLNGDYSYLKTQMNGKPIDAFNFANLEYSGATAIKDGMKDSLKSMATLGTVRYQTVQTPKYLILSNDELHLLDTDTDGDISNHLVFDSHRLSQSSLVEIPQQGTMKAFAKQKGDEVKAYKISLATDDKPIELILFSALIFTHVNTASNMLSMDMQKIVQENVIANDFLKKLGDKYPNLKVDVPILN